MKPILSLLLFSALLPMAGTAGTRSAAPEYSRDSILVLLRDFEEEFVRTQQTLRSNTPAAPGFSRTVYDIYHDLTDERVLLARKLIRRPHPSRYATCQAQISYFIMPRDSTLRQVERYLLSIDSLADNPAPCPAEFRDLGDALHDIPRGMRKFIVADFRPRMRIPADSVVYITPALRDKLTECLRMAWENNMHTEVLERINRYVPVRRGLMGGLRIGKPFVVNYILLEPDSRRAYVSILTENAEVYGMVMVRGDDGTWRIRTAKMLGRFVS